MTSTIESSLSLSTTEAWGLYSSLGSPFHCLAGLRGPQGKQKASSAALSPCKVFQHCFTDV